MLTTSLGLQKDMDTAIFPLLSYNQIEETFTCLGTAFFISPEGGFVTAKHLLLNNDGNMVVKVLLGIQMELNLSL